MSKLTKITTHVTSLQLEAIRKEADKSGLKAAEIIRRALDMYLKKSRAAK